MSDSVLVCWPLNTPWIEEDENGLLSVELPYAHYQWWLDGEPIPDATAAVYQTTGPGLYAVSVTDFEDCPGVISEDWLVVEVLESASTAADRRSSRRGASRRLSWTALARARELRWSRLRGCES